MKPPTYKTYFLLGFPHFGHTEGKVIARWDYPPPGKELQKALDAAGKEYDGFILVSPQGDLQPGNYTPPEAYDYYG